MRLIAWLVLLSFSAQAAGPVNPAVFSNFGKLSKEEQASVRSLAEACGDRKMTQIVSLTPEERKYATAGNKDLARVVINVAPENSSSATLIDCEAVGVGPFDLKKFPELRPVTAAGGPCAGDPESAYYELTKFSRDQLYHAELARCETEGTKLFSSECLKEIGCNVVRSVGGGAVGWIVKQFSHQIESEKKSCLGAGQDNCLSSLIDGFVSDLWGMVQGLWEGVKWVGKKIVQGVSWLYDYFTDSTVQKVESDVSKKLIAAKAATDSQISRFLEDPIAYIKGSIQNLMSWIMKQVEPLAREAAVGWKCATCDKLLNTGCRIAGMLGGELLVAFFTGGTLNFAAKAGKAGKIAEVLNDLSRLGRETAMGRAVVAVGRSAGRFTKAVLYLPGKAFELVGKLPGIKQFMSLNEQAFMRGYLGREGFLKLEQAKEAAALLKSTQSRLGAVLSPEEKALVLEHSEIKWAKMSKAEIRAKIESYREVPKVATEPLPAAGDLPRHSALEDAKNSPEKVKVIEDFTAAFQKSGQTEIPDDIVKAMDDIHNEPTRTSDGKISKIKAGKINDLERTLKEKYGFTAPDAQLFRKKMTTTGILGVSDDTKILEGQIKASNEMFDHLDKKGYFTPTRADDMIPGSSVVYKIEKDGKTFYGEVTSNKIKRPVDKFDKKEIPLHDVEFRTSDGSTLKIELKENATIPSSVFAAHNGSQAQIAYVSKATGQVTEIGEPLSNDILRLSNYKKGEKFNPKDFVVGDDELFIQRTSDEAPAKYIFQQRMGDRIVVKNASTGSILRIPDSEVKSLSRADCLNGAHHDSLIKHLQTEKASFDSNLYKAAPSIKSAPVGPNPWSGK